MILTESRYDSTILDEMQCMAERQRCSPGRVNWPPFCG